MTTPMTCEDVSAVIKTLVKETFDKDPHTPRQHANVQLNALSALIPLYDGNTKPGVCRSWMNKMEMVFTLVHLDGEETDKYKISYASLRLKGAAEEWFNLKRRLLISGTWKKFREDLIERFDPSMRFLDLHLESLRQDPEESFEDYFTRFGSLTETVFSDDEVTGRITKAAFVQGMADRAQRRELIRAQQTGTLDQAIGWVISLERD